MNATKTLGLLACAGLAGLGACTKSNMFTTSDWARSYDSFEPYRAVPVEEDAVTFEEARSVEELKFEPQLADYTIIGQANWTSPVVPEEAWPNPDRDIRPHAATRGADPFAGRGAKPLRQRPSGRPRTSTSRSTTGNEYPWPPALEFVNGPQWRNTTTQYASVPTAPVTAVDTIEYVEVPLSDEMIFETELSDLD